MSSETEKKQHNLTIALPYFVFVRLYGMR